jgi:hypothetical protein
VAITLGALMQSNALTYLENTAANRPAASAVPAGCLFRATDSGVWSFSDGTTWSQVNGLPAGTDGYELTADSTTATGLLWKPRSRVHADAHTDVSFDTSTAENTVFSQALPTTLVAGDVVRAVIAGDLLNNSGSSVNYAWRLYLGATLTLSTGNFSVATATTRRKWVLEAELLVIDPAASERVAGTLIVSTSSSGTMPLSTAATVGAGYAAAAENLTSAKNLSVTVQMGTAVSTADVFCHMGTIEVFKK